ncbi:hypothetical protein ACFVH6_21855 [Spirillospora sp. NPDC127200]
MPILAGTTTSSPRPPEYKAAVTVITDPAGHDWPLDGTAGVWRQEGRKGFHAPSYQHYRDESPAIDGAFWRGVRATTRELFIPVVIVGKTRAQLVATRRALIAAISPKRGECVISTVQPDDTRRSIAARYVDGMEGEEGRGAWGVLIMAYGLRFVADDPYMYGPMVPLEWGSDAVTRTELPIPGADTFYEVVSASQILGDSTVTNPGDVDSYPIWEFTGPFTEITLANATSGKSLTITHTASAADTLTIDTRPGRTAITDQNGTNRWAGLTSGYALWPLLPGDNALSIEVSGSTSDTGARMQYQPRYESD